LNPRSPAPKASALIQTTRETNLDSGTHSRLRARINGRYAKEISFLAPKTEEAIINTLIVLKGNALSEGVLKQISQKLRQIARNCNISDPNAVKTYIANVRNKKTNRPLDSTTKDKLIYAYDKFCTIHGIEWKRPYYQEKEKTPTIPTTENVNTIIDNATEQYAVIFRILKETGASGQELENMPRKDIDTEQRLIKITGCKRHGSATYKLTTQTTAMLRTYLHKNSQDHPFPTAECMGDAWRRTRNSLATKLCKPELKNILLKSLRNYSGAHLYYKTQDPIAVMRHLRHKKLETTMHYIRGITIGGEEEYTCKTATNVKQAKELIENGFQYITEMDGLKLFRKRK
jgi:integrase